MFADRTGGSSGYSFGVMSVDNIPDDGDGSETWTLEVSGKDTLEVVGMDTSMAMTANNKWDIVVANGVIYVMDGYMTIYGVVNDGGVWKYLPVQETVEGAYPFKSAQAADINGDGLEEVIVANYDVANGEVWVFQANETDYTLSDPAVIAELNEIGGARLLGGAHGDLDDDGNVDFVFGSRDSDGGVFRVEYQGGDVAARSSYEVSMIDSGIDPGGAQIDAVAVANLDDDPEMEVVYTQGYTRYGTVVPLVVLDLLEPENLETIADVKVPTDTSKYIPARVGETVTVQGIVNSVNFQKSSGNFGYFIQDGTAGINIFKYGEVGPELKVGDNVLVTGEVALYRGTTELELGNLDTNLVVLDTGRTVVPVELTIEDYLMNSEKYESMLIRLMGVAKNDTSAVWPSSGQDANIPIWDGSSYTTVIRIDRDGDLDENPEPEYPINVTGIATQFTYDDIPDNGYQISPYLYSDIEQSVATPPSPYFALLTPPDSSSFVIKTGQELVNLTWQPAVDLNGDEVVYQWKVLPDIHTENSADTSLLVSVLPILDYMDGADSLTVQWTVVAKGAEQDLVASVDTFTVTFIDSIEGELQLYLTHQPGDLQVAIFNDGSIGAENLDFGGPGVLWKDQNGLFSGGLVYGTGERGATNGLIGSWNSVDEDLISDIAIVESDFYMFDSDENFSEVTYSLLTDTVASNPYNVEIIQKSYSNGGDNFVFIRYGFINMNDTTLSDFYSGIFIDWDIDNYATNVGGYALDEHLVYQTDPGDPYYGVTAINGLDGGAVTTSFPDDAMEGREDAFSFISNVSSDPVTSGADYRTFQGTSLGDIAPGDTAWVTFAIVAGDDLLGIRENANAAFAKAMEIGWTDIQVAVKDKEVIPEAFYVDQNYPNPFNPSTTIKFGVPQEAQVDMRIYDILGQQVSVLINNEVMRPGVHTVQFNASRLASGTYIYRIKAGDKVFTKKMMLIK